ERHDHHRLLTGQPAAGGQRRPPRAPPHPPPRRAPPWAPLTHHDPAFVRAVLRTDDRPYRRTDDEPDPGPHQRTADQAPDHPADDDPPDHAAHAAHSDA